jgi:protein-L-isoaspartate(D-aspartate) O-methyltransferase
MRSTSLQQNDDALRISRQRLVQHLRTTIGIKDEKVLTAMAAIPRHLFVPEALWSQAYKDNALPIAAKQTISQPAIVARMTELLELESTHRVLEIGAGSGYQTAVIASIARRVFAVERINELYATALPRLRSLGFNNVSMICSDGTEGWKTYAPFDRILVAAGGPEIPQPLVDQLVIGGKLVLPVGEEKEMQRLVRVTRTEEGFAKEDFGPCSFVPLIGKHGWS